MQNKAYLSLGSNLGDRFQFLQRAIKELDANSSINVVNISSVYETDPVGYIDQDAFLNVVVLINTALTPQALLAECMRIELELGRKREKVWGPRTIDLDILLYNQENIETESLIIPHPRMKERAFVLVPLLEIVDANTIANEPWMDQINVLELQEKEGVRLWKRKSGEDVFAPIEN